jgi:Secretion system C-terminal sorting domain
MALFTAEDTVAGAGRILNYSNPNIHYKGIPTGTPINFNARHASHNICSVDDYFYDDELGVNIVGPTFICDTIATYTASITLPGAEVQGVGPYSIIWRVNDTEYFSFLDQGTPLGTINPLSLYSRSFPSPEFWLFVSVSSADGVIVNDVVHVDNPCGVPNPLIVSTSDYKTETEAYSTAHSFEISPNPAHEHLYVNIAGLSIEKTANYSILNALGEIVFNGTEVIDTYNNVGIDLSSKRLPSGLYYLYLSVDSFTGVQKFIIQN